ncbi:MAG: HAMP domain-containing protein [Nitrospiraceae bacterium]|nr:MAG: HAMP domain-containing protein [Nitrospiraceae bacterium]
MKSYPGSIKGRFFLWSILITAAVLIFLGISLYVEIRKSILGSIEQTLHSKIQILKGLIHEEHGMIELELAEVVSGEYSVPRSGHYYKVLLDNEVLAASPSLVDEAFDLDSGKLFSHDPALQQRVSLSVGPAKEPVMVVRHDFPLFDAQATVYAAQSLSGSLQLISRFRMFLFAAIGINTAVLALAGLWIARHALRPLEEFSTHIEKITHKTMDEKIDPAFQAEEIRKVAGSFNAMLDRLQHAFEMEKSLVADASHELKTPLSIIKAQCDVLLQKDRTKEEYTRALSQINATSDAMKNLIADMLSLARIDAGILPASRFRVVSLNHCIDRAVKLAEFSAGEKHISVHKNMPAPVQVRGDEDVLTEMIFNIVDNAVKYSPEGGTVDIALLPDNSSVQIEVRDHGKGIRAEDLERVFDRFYRSDTARSTDGTGLGLSIARAVAESHGGTISVGSQTGRGSRFVIRLPRHRA